MESIDVDFYPLDPAVRRIALNVASEPRNAFEAIRANISPIRELRRVVRELNPDVVLGIMTVASVLATEHTYPPQLPLNRLWSSMRRWSFRAADRVVALTDKSKHWLEEHCACTDVRVMPPPFTLPIPHLEPILDPDTVVPRNRRVLLAVGRLSDAKDFDYLIDAFAKIADSMPEWDLVIVGEGDLRPSLEK